MLLTLLHLITMSELQKNFGVMKNNLYNRASYTEYNKTLDFRNPGSPCVCLLKPRTVSVASRIFSESKLKFLYHQHAKAYLLQIM